MALMATLDGERRCIGSADCSSDSQLEQFQEKCKRFSQEKRVALSLGELRKNKEIERFAGSVKR